MRLPIVVSSACAAAQQLFDVASLKVVVLPGLSKDARMLAYLMAQSLLDVADETLGLNAGIYAPCRGTGPA